MEGDQLKSESRPVVSRPRSGSLDGKRPAVLRTIVARPQSLNSDLDESVAVDREALRIVLLELQDLRARQGADWRWTDSLHPTLRRELDAAIADELSA